MPQLLTAVLAAGASRRLGTPKQLVEIAGEPLLHRQCRVALEANLGPVAAVLGCHAESCIKSIGDLPVTVLINRDWDEGMASSVRLASQTADEAGYESLLILLVDQHQVTSHDLGLMYEAWLHASPTQACRAHSEEYRGPPVILARSLFPQCRALSGDEGARRVLASLGPRLVLDVGLPSAVHDLDLLAELEALRPRNDQAGGEHRQGR